MIGNRPPRKGSVTGKPGNRANSESVERLARVAGDSALKVEAASQASASAAAIDAAVPPNLQDTLNDYATRLDNLENPP